MVYKEMAGRLGNQLFQYATMYAFIKDNDLDDTMCLSFERVSKLQNNFYDSANTLKDYNIDNIKIVNKIKLNLLQRFLIFMMRGIEFLLRKFIRNKNKYEYVINKFEVKIQPFLNMFSVYFMTFGYTKLKKGIFKNYIFHGNFESSKYFENYKSDLKKLFVPKEKELKCNKKLYEEIKKSNSVCISIRRGDFLDNKNIKKFYSCDEFYFNKCIDVIKSRVDNPKFFVFSDDIEWVKENMTFPNGTVFENGNDPVYEKLRLMYSCKHFIISNSTFSYWCQYLSDYDKKIVVAPKRWRNYGYYNDIYENDWVLIDN